MFSFLCFRKDNDNHLLPVGFLQKKILGVILFGRRLRENSSVVAVEIFGKMLNFGTIMYEIWL